MKLTTSYLGLELAHPVVVGASPLGDTVDSARRMEDAGTAALVLRSIFQEQIDRDAIATQVTTEAHAESFGEATTYLPSHHEFVMGPDEYLERLRRIKQALNVPVIASLNGSTRGGWVRYATGIEQAGADALELNVYDVPVDPERSASAIEDDVVEIVREVKARSKLKVAVKLSPFYTALVPFADRLAAAGADGLVLFNRFFDPDIDVDELEVTSRLQLSDSSELGLRLRWIAILSPRFPGSIAVTGGVHDAADAVKALMCGADVTQCVSAVLRDGPQAVTGLVQGIREFLAEAEYESLAQLRGSMDLTRCPDPAAYRRANYMRVLQTWSPPER